ncbi:MAG TPA: Holliday junction resolvase RuvX [Thermoanaerobaculia bacterium]|nr:Holliday junction resolvase RuvX [Thermoanaerobaculia bacterium]
MTTLAVDYGTRRIGIAVSTSGVLATPHTILLNDGDLATAVERIAAIGDEVGAERYVVGLPRRSRSGSDDPALAPYRDLAAALGQKTRKEVILWDEGFSTTEAASKRRERGERSRRRGARAIDMEAAAIILQSFLDESRRA